MNELFGKLVKYMRGINPSAKYSLDRLHRALALLLCLLLSLTQFPMSALADGGRAASFNQELMDAENNWGILGGEGSVSGRTVTLNPAVDGEAIQAQYEIDLTPLQDAVNGGGLQADISYSASPEGTTVSFSAGGNELSNGDTIPSGSTSILVTLVNPTSSTAEFTLSLAFNDNDPPSLSTLASTDTWSNTNVILTPSADDADSGVSMVYESDSSGNPISTLTDNGDGTYTASENGTYYFTAQDFAEHSTTVSYMVDNIDKAVPSSPSISLSVESGWATSDVTATITGSDAPEGQSPQSIEYSLNGSAWTRYSGTLTLSDEGDTELRAHIIDEAGNVSDSVSAIARIDTQPPELTASFGQTGTNNMATLTFTASDDTSGILEKRYMEGEHTEADYSSAAVLSGNTVSLAAGKQYTVFARDNAGHIALQTLYASAVPSLSLPGSFSIQESESKSLNFTVGDSETAAGSLTVSVVSADSAALSVGTVQNSDGTVSVPLTAADSISSSHSVNLTVTVTDGDGQSTTGLLAVTLQPVNDAPVAVDDDASVNEDSNVSIPVLTNDTDEENDTLSILSIGTPSHGTAVKLGNEIIYTPAANYNGNDTFSYTITDGNKSATGSVTITVNPVPDTPVAVNAVLNILEDTPVEIDLLKPIYVTDADIGTTQGDILSITAIDAVTYSTVGTVTILNEQGLPAAEGERGLKVLYTPEAEFSGTDQFRYTITDSYGRTCTATVTVKISAVNDAPEYSLLNSSYTVDEDCGTYTLHFGVNDKETPADSLMLQAVSLDNAIIPNTSLSLSKAQDGSATLSFAPAANQNGTARLQFSLGDGFQTVEKTVSIIINPVNDAPYAGNDTISYTEDTACTIDPAVLLANDSDIESGKPTFLSIKDWPEAAGTLTQTGDTFLFTPTANYNQNFTFHYIVEDADGAQTQATVTMRATAVNDKPTISTEVSEVTISEDSATAPISFTINDEESSVDELTVTAGSDNNTLISPDGIKLTTSGSTRSITLTPNPDQFGEANITLTVSDSLSSTTATIKLIVTAVQDSPTAANDAVAALRTGDSLFTAASLLANDSDPDNDTLTILEYTQPGCGTLSLQSGTFTYHVNTDIADDKATDTFQYTVSDGNGNTATATVTVSLSGESAAPIITSIADQYVLEDFLTASVGFQATDPDGTEPTVTAVMNPEGIANLQLIKGENGSYTLSFASISNLNGETQITITARDGASKTATISFKLTVYPVNDAPVAGDVELSLQEDISRSFNPITLAGSAISDVENDTLHIVSMTRDGVTGAKGRLTSQGSGNYLYDPYSNVYGTETYTYVVSDGKDETSGKLNITITPVNDAPWFRSAIYQYVPNEIDAQATIDVAANARDVDDSAFYIDSFTQPESGTVTVVDNKIVFTRTGTTGDGTDSFTVTVRDRETNETPFNLTTAPDGYRTATVTVNIGTYSGDYSWVYNASYETDEDAAPFTIYLDCGVSGGIPYTITLGSNDTEKGTASVDSAQKCITYSPKLNANGSDTFTYTLSATIDDVPVQKTATVYVTLRPVNDAPVFDTAPAQDSVTQTDEDTAATGIPVAVSDVDGDQLTLNAYAYNANPQEPVLLPSGIQLVSTEGGYTLNLTPVPNANGDATVTLSVSDGMISTQRSFTLHVIPVNDAPVAQDYSVGIQEDTPTAIALISANSDIDNAASTLTLQCSEPSHGDLTINADGVLYTPDANYYGGDSFTYTISDPQGGVSNTATVTIDVSNVNDAPRISGLSPTAVMLEDGTSDIPYTILDEDAEDTHTANLSIVSETPEGLFPPDDLKAVNGTITLKPGLNQYGTAVLLLTVTDSSGAEATEQISVTVLPENDLPVAVDDAVTLEEDSSVEIEVTANDTDAEDAAGSLRILEVDSYNAHGVVTVLADKHTIKYTPSANYTQAASLKYRVVDSNNGYSNWATVTFTIQPVNDAPNAAEDKTTTTEDTPVTIDVLHNDSDAEGSALSIVSPTTEPIATSHGSAVLSDGKITYTPAADYFGTDSFQYTITDGELTGTGTVNVTVNAVNDPPVIVNITPFTHEPDDKDCWIMSEDETKTFQFDASDAYNETPPQSLIVKITSSNQYLLPDASIAYSGSTTVKSIAIKPVANAYGDTELTVTANDGVNTTEAVFLLRVRPVNDKPVLTTDASISLDEDTSYRGECSAYDVEGSDVCYTISADPQHGGVTIDSYTGDYTYTPDENYYGADEFTIRANDEDVNNYDEVAVAVTVNSVNDLPVAVGENGTTAEDTPLVLTFDELLANDSDIETTRSSLTISAAGGAQHGTAALDASGRKITYTPASNYNGTDSFTYTVKDMDNGTATATVNVTITPVNDAPSALNKTVSIGENDGATTIPMSTLASDVEGDVLEVAEGSVSFVETETFGATFSVTDGQLTITPNKDWTQSTNQTLHLNYQVQESAAPESNVQGTLTVTLTPVNDAPTITIDTVGNPALTFDEDSTGGTISFTVTDEEDDASLLTVTASGSKINTTALNAALVLGTGSSRTAQVTSLLNQNGATTVTLTVKDTKNATDPAAFNVYITPVNDVPTAVSSTIDVKENDGKTAIAIAKLATDVDGNALAVQSATFDETEHYNATVSVESGTLYITPDANWKEYTTRTVHVTYTVVESGTSELYTVQGNLTVNLIPQNDAPHIVISTPSLSFDEDDPAGDTVSFTVSDEEDDASALTVTAAGSDTIINIPALNSALALGTGADRSALVTSLLDANGSATVTLTVKDTSNITSSDTFDVTIAPVNDAPRLEENPSISIKENDGKTAVPFDTLVLDVEENTIEVVESSVTCVEGNTFGAAISVENGVLYITPDQNWTQTQTQTIHLTYQIAETVTTEHYTSEMGTLTVNLIPENDAPVISAIADLNMLEKTIQTVRFTVTDEDDAPGALTVTVTSTVPSLHKPLSIQTDSEDPNTRILTIETTRFYGTSNITISAKDDENKLAVPEPFKLTVGWQNDSPVAADDTYSLNEDGSLSMDVLANDSDDDVGIGGVNAQTLSILAGSVTTPQHGTAVIQSGKILYTPAKDYFGPDSFTYKATDSYAGSTPAQATVYVTVNPVNDAPVAVNDSASTAEDTALQLEAAELLANDTDVENNTLTLTGVQNTASTHGTVSFDSLAGTVTYTPALNYHGSASFTYTISDGNGGTATGTVNITVNSVNDAPVAMDDSVTVSEDAADASLTVLSNDSDVDGDALTITAVTQPAHGSVSIDGTAKALLFTPAENDNGQATFTYTISDGNGGTDTATVTVTIDAVNDAPAAADDTATIEEDAPQTGINVLANDTDIDGDTLTVTAISNVQHGTAQIAPGGTAALFTPDADFYGDASFTYTVSDGGGGTDTANVTVTVTPVNDAPEAKDDFYTLAEDAASTTLNVLANDTDIENDHLTVTGVTNVQHGTAEVLPDGSGVSFAPEANFYGTATFTYAISDGNGGTDTADVTVTVTPVNDAPVAVNDEPDIEAYEDTPVVIPFSALLENDTDVDTPHEQLTVAGYNATAHGTVSIDSTAKTLTFTPAENYHGEASFQYMISDGALPSNYATVRFMVASVNDTPVPQDDGYTIEEDTRASLDVLVNDEDADGDSLTITDVTSPANGTAVIDTEHNKINVAPAANFNGTLSFSYTVSDGKGGTATANVTVTVTPLNDAPSAADDSLTTAEDTALVLTASSLLVNDTDIDGDTISLSRVESSGLTHGSITYDPAVGTLTYTPTQNYHGNASFTYGISDGNGGTASATARITVTPVDDAPIAVDDTATVRAGSTVTVNVLSNDSDQGDGDTLTVQSTLATAPANGTAVVNSDGTIAYTANSSYKGDDSFVYVLTDGIGTAQAKVTVTVTARPSNSSHSTPTPEPVITIIDTPEPTQRPATSSGGSASTPAPAPSAQPTPSAPTSTSPSPTGSQDVTLYNEEKPMESGEWSNTPVNLAVTDENGQPDTMLYRLKGETEWKTLPVGEELTFSETGEYTVEYRSGNSKEIKEKVVLVDLLPPAVPEMTQTTGDDGSITISFNFLSDPGNSGNEFLILPTGEKIPLGAPITFTAPKDGEYTFTLIDKAGNTTTFNVPVKAAVHSVNLNFGPEPAQTWRAVAAAGIGLLLLLLLFRRPVKFIYEGNDNTGKKYRAVRKRFARIPKKEKTLTLALNPPKKARDAHELTVRFTRPFTRFMRQRHVALTLDDRKLGEFYIEKDQKGNWEVTLPL